VTSPTPCFTAAVEPAAPRPRSIRGASVTPLHPRAVVPALPRRAPHRGWTLFLVPPARAPEAVRTVALRRRHLLLPLVVVALLLGAVAYAAARLGAWTYDARMGPEIVAVRDRLAAGEERVRLMADSLGMLRAQVAALAAARDAATPVASARRSTRAAPAAVRTRAEGVVLPVEGRITSYFSAGRVHPILHIRRAHRGLDIAAPAGTTIRAPAAGRVASVRRELGYGLVLRLDHGGGVTTRYAHLRSALVKGGESVTAGMAIATVGSSGLATGPHLHYEVRVRGDAVDPLRTPVPPTR
jgi:murein DD-endopeptidase MepM/ murein hydrolase activator NlpD